jgi:hypothetical protein
VDLRTVRTIRSAIEIRAPLETVWQVLTDFAAYPEWNPHIRLVRGKPGAGRRVSIHSAPPGGRGIRFRPRITSWQPPNELRWKAVFFSSRLFTGERGFRLEALGADRVRFVQDETFRGLLVPLYSRFRLAATRRGFEQMNQALRERAEAMAGGRERTEAERREPLAARGA